MLRPLPGFRDFFPAECSLRNYILNGWRTVARRYGFLEIDGPTLEPVELYRKKSGGELLGQLFDFPLKGEDGELVAMRPELTPTLARMAAARANEVRKPIRWFATPLCFRYERQQRGRLREFYQLNCDIIGDDSPAADGELISMLIDVLRAFGLGAEEFIVRISDRHAWTEFAARHGVAPEQINEFLALVDKMERMKTEEFDLRLAGYGVSREALLGFIANPLTFADRCVALLANLEARGLRQYVEVDFSIVRGLAYYTGVVFEVFDRARSERAIAGGGRYDTLLTVMSDGKVTLPAIGFGMGDVVLANVIDKCAPAAALRDSWCANAQAVDLFVVIAAEELRSEALLCIQELRDHGVRVDYPFAAAKVGKQFQAADQSGARYALIVGNEWPQVKLKNLTTREEHLVDRAALASFLIPADKGLTH
jgi:histidyl-tRNA synthetase